MPKAAKPRSDAGPDAWAQWFNQANAAYRLKEYAEAAGLYRQVNGANPGWAAAYLGLARCLVAQGDHAAALVAFKACVQREPGQFSAWLEQAHALRVLGHMDEAVQAYERAVALEPARFEAPLGLVRTLEVAGRRDEAARWAEQTRQALAQREAWKDLQTFEQQLGRYRMELGDLASAYELLRSALRRAEPAQQGKIRLDLAEILLRNHQVEPANALMTEISKSEDGEVLEALAQLSYRYNLHHEAVAVLRKRVELMPQSGEALMALASMQAECWQLTEAEQTLRAAEALGKGQGADTLRARIAAKLGDAETSFRLNDAWLQTLPADKAQQTRVRLHTMSSLYCDFFGPHDIVRLHREACAHLADRPRERSAFDWAEVAQAGVSRRIRLGLVSGDFHHQHPVNIFMQPVLRELDRRVFEVTMYYNGTSADEETAKARRRVDHWLEATYLTDAQLALRIDQDRIDILLDLSGHTDKNRMRLFANRAAPIQVTYLGYPGSTGVPNMDWILGDDTVTPPEQATLYSEQVARLPGNVFCYAPETDYPFPQFGEAHRLRPLTFGCFNNLTKVTPHTLRLWQRILEALPQSRLLLKAPSFSLPAAQALYFDKLQAIGFDTRRLLLQGPEGLSDMMARYEEVDIALDPMPYNGGTTSLQAMWMGAPVVCKAGAYFTSRMSASFMRHAGLPDWVAETDDDYVRIAVEKGRDRAGLLALKQGMRERQLSRAAWDPVAHTRAFEDSLRQMLAAACAPGAAQPPAPQH